MVEVVIFMLGAGAALALGWFVWGRGQAALRGERDALSEKFAAAIRDLAGAQTQADRLPAVEAELNTARVANARLDSDLAALRAGAEERDRAHARQLEQMKQQFEAMAASTLEGAQKQFLRLADETFARHRQEASAGLEKNKLELKAMLEPVQTTLKRYEENLTVIEKARSEAYGSLQAQLEAVGRGQSEVRAEAAKLVSALRSSSKASGSWGEEQLKNVLEMAGLREGIDFDLQLSTGGTDDLKRPDAIIRLPGGRCLVVDSKCSLDHYLTGCAAGDDGARTESMRAHARATKAHADGLTRKAYWDQFAGAAEFVVMFVPGENFLSAALEHDVTLLGWAFDRRILLAGPINLLAIAKTVALVWRQEKLADEAREVARLGVDLYEALKAMAGHVHTVGRHLDGALDGYNKFVGSLERNVLPKARRFPEMGIAPGDKPMPSLTVIEGTPRSPVAPELVILPPADAAE